MADYTKLYAAALIANTQTDVTGGGVQSGEAGAFSLNVCNDSDADASLLAIYVTPSGVAPSDAYKVQPAFSVEARGWAVIQPIKLGEGFKVWVQSSVAVSAQLIGRKEG